MVGDASERSEALWVEREGVRLHAHDRGPSDGEPVVLLHGFPQDSTCWDGVVPLLHQAGHRTLALDQRGYGASDRPAGVRPYRIEELTADVVALVHSAGFECVHLIGHDWGGAVAWNVAARHPEVLRTLTVLSTPHPTALSRSMRSSLQPLLSWYAAAFQVPLLPELVLAHTLERVLRTSGLPPVVARAYADRFASPLELGPPLAWYRAVGRRLPWDTLGDVPTVDVPTTYVWGWHDPTLGRAAAEATGDHVDGPYSFVEADAGHWLPELHPALVAGAFLQGLLSTADDAAPTRAVTRT